jgi:hypothetical protein
LKDKEAVDGGELDALAIGGQANDKRNAGVNNGTVCANPAKEASVGLSRRAGAV